MDIDMVISVTVFLPGPLWAREGAPSAPTQSWKQAQLLRYSQNGTVVFSSWSSTGYLSGTTGQQSHIVHKL